MYKNMINPIVPDDTIGYVSQMDVINNKRVYLTPMVLGTALDPLLLGFLLDKEISFTGIMLGLAVLMLMAIINAQRLKRV